MSYRKEINVKTYYYLGKEDELLNDGFTKVWDDVDYYSKNIPFEINEDDSIGIHLHSPKSDLNGERERVFEYNLYSRQNENMDQILENLINQGLVISREFKDEKELEAFRILFDK